MCRQNFLCFLGCCLFLSSAGQLRTDGRNSYDLNSQVYYYAEGNAGLSGEEAFRIFKKGMFLPVATPGNNVNFGYTDSIYWLAFMVNITDTAEHLETGVANAGLYHLEHYQFADNGELLFSHGPTGKHYPFNSRYINNRHYYYPLQNNRGHQPVTVLFRADLRGSDFYAPLRLVKETYRAATEQEKLNFYFLLEGILISVLFFGIIAISATRQRVFVYYFFYTLSYALLLFACSDWDFRYLYPDYPGWAIISTAMYGGATLLFMLLFSMVYLQIKKSHPLLYKASLVVIACVSLLLLCIPFFYSFYSGHNRRYIVFIFGAITVCASWVLQFALIIIRLINRFKPAYIYAAANMPVIISAVYFVLHSLGTTRQDEMILPAMAVAFGIEILVMCVALIYQLNSHRVKHAQLLASLYRRESDFKEQLILTQEAERKRIAEDLHDELGSSLAALKLRLQRAGLAEDELINILAIIDKASADTRSISHNLMPPEFEETELCLLLSNFYSRLSTESPVLFHFHYSGTDHRFTKNEELSLYRIIMELTSNILKHSNAREATVQLIYYDDHLEIMAEDNGQGISGYENSGLGMKNIQSRINYLNGEMKIDTGPKGTTIIISIPYKK